MDKNQDIGSNDEDYLVREAMRHYIEGARALLHSLVYGTTSDVVGMLRDKENVWVSKSADKRLLTWYSRGIKDKKLKNRLRNGKDSIGKLNGAISMQFNIMRAKKERDSGYWRKGLKHLDSATRKAVTADKVAGFNDQIAKYKAKIKVSFQKAEEYKNNIQK